MIDSLSVFLNKQFQERTLLLLFLTALIGGFFGASFKLIFEVILAGRYKEKQEAKRIVNIFSNPIVRSADALRGRIAN